MEEPSNGWATGRDPVQRRLRIVTTIVCLAVFVYLAVDDKRGLDVVPIAGLALGALMILLGYERLIRLPGLTRRKGDDE